jgi:hypothetical protein
MSQSSGSEQDSQTRDTGLPFSQASHKDTRLPSRSPGSVPARATTLSGV